MIGEREQWFSNLWPRNGPPFDGWSTTAISIASILSITFFVAKSNCLPQFVKVRMVKSVKIFTFIDKFLHIFIFSTESDGVHVLNWHLKEGHFCCELAPNRRPISVVNWHPNEGHFDGELTSKRRFFWRQIGTQKKANFGGKLAPNRRLFGWRTVAVRKLFGTHPLKCWHPSWMK